MTRPRDIADSINRINSSAADATAVTIDSSENVGIGTATTTDAGVTITNSITRAGSWDAKLALQSTGANDFPALLFTGSATDRYGGIVGTTDTSGDVANNQTAQIQLLHTSDGGNLAFRTNDNIGSSSTSERMRINASGEVGIGTTGTSGMVFVQSTSSTKPCVFSLASNTGYSGVLHRIRCATASGSGFFPIFVESGNGSDTEFFVRGNGEVAADGSFTGGGADYAEMFEWADGNSDNEDRRGFSVVLTGGNKIRKATSDDAAADIIGIVSANPSVVGDTASMKWEGKYLKDDFGNYILENYTVTNWIEGETTHSYETDKIPSDVTVPEDAVVSDKNEDGNELKRRKLNPDYDDTNTYIPRNERQEWDAIGMVGKLRMRSGQPTGDRWIKMRDIASGVEEWLVR